MILTFNQKIELILSENDKRIIDSQSKTLNYLYNLLLDKVEKEYKENKKSDLLNGYNLRNLIPKIKEEKPYLYTIHSSPLKNVAIKLKQSYQMFFKGINKHPHYLSFKKKFFSLYYDEPNKGIKVDGKKVRISLGKDINNKRLYINSFIKEDILPYEVRNFRIKKENKKYYLIICLNKYQDENEISLKIDRDKYIAIDPNHKNMFVGIDYFGNTIQMDNFSSIKYFDKEIDKLKSKRDKCKKKSKKIETQNDNFYYKTSKKYYRYDKALDKLYQKRREQIKCFCYTLANELTDHYDVIAIGDYVPKKTDIKQINKVIINESIIGKFRKILKWVCDKKGKELIIVNEYHTTKECCNCKHEERKDPTIREFTCPNCGIRIERDKNSAINIAKKAQLILSGSDYLMRNNISIKYTISYNYKNNKITIDKINDYYEYISDSLINMVNLNPYLFDEMHSFV